MRFVGWGATALALLAGAELRVAASAPPGQASTQSNANTQSAAIPAKPPAKQQPAATSTMVWVNTESGLYHKPGSRYYRKSEKSKYMTEADAI